MMKGLGVEYILYHACPNNCILYRDAYGDKETCPKCGCDRYQESKNKRKAHGVPHKLLRHMPIIPRIQRLFRVKQLVDLKRWHASHRSELGVMRILAYSIAMRHIEDTWLDKFKEKVCNH